MKRLRLDRFACQLQQHAPRNPRSQVAAQHHQTASFSQHSRGIGHLQIGQQSICQSPTQSRAQRQNAAGRRKASGLAATTTGKEEAVDPAILLNQTTSSGSSTEITPSENVKPQSARRKTSAKLSALHARLALPAKLPIKTLARCLVDASANPQQGYNNAPLAVLGQDLLGYYTSEYLICHYPRLPMSILFAAQYAYVGPATLAAMREEWGVEVVAAPGPEVDPGLLQLRRTTPGNALADSGQIQLKDMAQPIAVQKPLRRGIPNRIVHDDQFGEAAMSYSPDTAPPYAGAPLSSPADASSAVESSEPSTRRPRSLAEVLANPPESPSDPTTVTAASATFVRALVGALHLHAGPAAAKQFHAAHILSRHLALHSLFNFTHPTRDLSFLCAREHLVPPVARLLSETGRLSRSPVYVVGVFSGSEKLGEGAGSSLDEARVRAAAAALRAWYLYSPLPEQIMLPSEMEAESPPAQWKKQLIDPGEIIA